MPFCDGVVRIELVFGGRRWYGKHIEQVNGVYLAAYGVDVVNKQSCIKHISGACGLPRGQNARCRARGGMDDKPQAG